MGRCNRFGHYYDGGFGAASWVETQVASSSRDDDAYVGVCQIIPSQGVNDCIGHLFLSQLQVDSGDFDAFVEASDVLFQSEDCAVIGSDSFEYSVAVEKAVIVY